MRRVCAPPRTDSLVPTNMTSTAILRVCSGSLAATRKGRSRACHFGTLLFQVLVQNFLRLRRASDDLSLTARPGFEPRAG